MKIKVRACCGCSVFGGGWLLQLDKHTRCEALHKHRGSLPAGDQPGCRGHPAVCCARASNRRLCLRHIQHPGRCYQWPAQCWVRASSGNRPCQVTCVCMRCSALLLPYTGVSAARAASKSLFYSVLAWDVKADEVVTARFPIVHPHSGSISRWVSGRLGVQSLQKRPSCTLNLPCATSNMKDPFLCIFYVHLSVVVTWAGSGTNSIPMSLLRQPPVWRLHALDTCTVLLGSMPIHPASGK